MIDSQPYQGQAFSWHCTPAVAQGVVYAQICNPLFALGSRAAVMRSCGL
ncbi:hypothetical protein L6R29_21410 [Myxococcota bacterium]|nr:hypothetical protein [Myxococcota bacterium]